MGYCTTTLKISAFSHSLGCNRITRCQLQKQYYYAAFAQQEYEAVRSESRQGIATAPEELQRIDTVISPLIKQGQSIHHICSTHANVQPHSGANANLAAFFALVKPGDTVMGMNLAHGGHLSHGSPVNISGKYFNIVPYGLDETTEQIDYDALMKIAQECKPKLIVAGASAYPRTIDFKKFREVADAVGAYLMVDMAPSAPER